VPFLWERLCRECRSPVLANFSKRYLCGTIRGTTGFLPAGFVPKFGECEVKGIRGTAAPTGEAQETLRKTHRPTTRPKCIGRFALEHSISHMTKNRFHLWEMRLVSLRPGKPLLTCRGKTYKRLSQ